ncbi:MAG: PDZ domain-containing protein [Cyanobacteria bacterium TGS_CYA1]|nr:PDZ domain-containing protein [Cyanobacteria bacterium TGS_CYA1]
MPRLSVNGILASSLLLQISFALSGFAQTVSYEDKLKAGDHAVSTHDFEQGISLYKEARQIGESENSKYEMAEASRKTAVALAGAARYDEAIESFNQSLADATDLKNAKVIRTVILSKFGLAKMYSVIGNQDLAWINLEEAITLASENLSANDPVVPRLTALKSELILSKAQIAIEPPKTQKAENQKPANATLVAEISMSAPAVIPQAPGAFQKLQLEKGVLEVSQNAKTQDHALTGGVTSARKELAVRLMQYGTIGLLLSKNIGGPWIVQNTLNGGAAQYYGVQKGDILASIDGQDISQQNITSLHFMLTGRRGQIKHLELIRPGHKLELQIPLWSVYDMHDRNSEYIEYYWFLLYNNLITPEQYQRLAKPFEPYIQ